MPDETASPVSAPWPARARPARLERDARALRRGGERGGRGLGVASDDDLDFERVGRRRLGDVAHCVEHAREQRAELELVEEHTHAFAVEGALREVLGSDVVEVDVAREP